MKFKAFCCNCNTYFDVNTELKDEEYVIDGVKFHTEQEHLYCPSCGNELFPDKIMDINIRRAHNDYITARRRIK